MPENRIARVRAGLAIAIIALVGLTASPALASTLDTWNPAHPLMTARVLPQAARLANGDVVVAGGGTSASAVTDSAEIYSPATDAWTPAANMGTPRFQGSAVTLPGGNVLVVGGQSGSATSTALNTGEVYNPTANTWTPVTNTMGSERTFAPVTVLLPNGLVLIAGGTNAGGAAVASADLYDPAQNAFLPASAMGAPRSIATGTLVDGGRVLVAGGSSAGGAILDTGEVYDPTSGGWTAVANTMSSPRAGAGAAALASGRALIVGGESSSAPLAGTATTDLYDPSTNRFTAGPDMSTARVLPGVALLRDGRVLAVGGAAVNGASASGLASSEVYDPRTNSWSISGSLPAPDYAFALTPLTDGRVLLAGGTATPFTPVPTTTAELFTPAAAPGAPQSVTAIPGNGSAVVTFAPPASDGGAPILHYTITASTGQTVSTPDGRTFATIAGLTNGKGVNFSVTATNAIGTGPSSGLSPAVTPMGPDQPAKVKLFGVPRKLTLGRFLRGVRFSFLSDKPASLMITLVGGARTAVIARSYNLTLASKRLHVGVRRRSVKLTPRRRLVGRPRRATIELVIVATDGAGTRSRVTRKIQLRR